MEKLKEFIIKYKWWIVGAVAAIGAFILFRGRGGGGGDSQMSAEIAATESRNQQQAQIDSQDAQLQAQLAAERMKIDQQTDLEHLTADTEHYKTETQYNLGVQQLDVQKYLGNLQAQTSTALAQMQEDTSEYTSNIQLQAEQIRADTESKEIDAQKYVVDKQAKIEQQKNEFGFIGNLLNFGGKFL